MEGTETLILPFIAQFTAFLAVVLAVFALYLFAASRAEEIRRRLHQILEHKAPGGKGSPAQKEGVFLVRWLEPAGEMILPQKEWRRSAIKRRLVQAGFRQSRAIRIFLGAKLALAIGIPVIISIAGITFITPIFLSQPRGIALVTLMVVIGFLIPDLVVRMATRRRQRDYVEGFPDALDMLVVCVEAGLGLDAAIDRVARELRYSHPPLAIELGLISMEIRAGMSREEALRSLADRMGVDHIRALVTILIQTERFGTSIASALRGFAKEMRTERLQRARETAAKLPVRMIFPIMFFIFPALFLVILGPAAIRIYQALINV